jgi:hypothetical protein
VLPVSLEGDGAAAQEGVARLAVLGDLVGPVVVHLVVVPGDEPGEGGVGGLEVGIGLVLRVAVAVVLERDDLRTGVRAHVAARDRVFVRAVLVDVVAEVDDEVEILARHVPVGRVVAVLVLLAGGEREVQRVRRTGRSGLRPAHRADLAAGTEAVEVLGAGPQAIELDVDAVAPLGSGLVLAAAHDAPEAVVERDLPVHVHIAVRHAAAAQRGGREPGPQHRAVRRRIAGGHAERERIADEPRRRLARSRERRLAGGGREARRPGGGQEFAAGQKLPFFHDIPPLGRWSCAEPLWPIWAGT